MSTMCVPSKTFCPASRAENWNIWSLTESFFDLLFLLQTHIITYSALNLLTKRYNTYSTYKYYMDTVTLTL